MWTMFVLVPFPVVLFVSYGKMYFICTELQVNPIIQRFCSQIDDTKCRSCLCGTWFIMRYTILVEPSICSSSVGQIHSIHVAVMEA